MDRPTGGRTGGVYIPPFKLAQMKRDAEASQGKANEEHQKLHWEALRKSINGLINKVNVSNIKNIVPELFQENLIWGRGLFARAIMKAQLASPGFTHIYASLIAVINTKLPENGELILKRVIYSFKRAYKRRDKLVATALAKFIAHLVNHQVAHELLALQLLTVLLEEPTDDSVEIAVNFTKEVGQILEELSPQGLHAVFERFRGILHEGDIDKRVQYTVEALFAIRKSGFKDYPAIPAELDLVEREDQITFELGLDDEVDKEEMLDIFRYDANFEENQKLWENIKREILGDDDDEADDEAGDDDDADEEAEEVKDSSAAAIAASSNQKIVDMTQQDLINLRRTIYLTIMSAVSFEECCHKLTKLNLPDGLQNELCNMLVECCINEKSYLKFYGLVGQRFCENHRKYQDAFDEVFLNQYNTIHRLETNKLRNLAKFFAHLLATDALPWTCFEYIKLNEYDTTSSSRIFIKVVIQEIVESMGLAKVKERYSDPYMQDVFSNLFPRDNPRNTRFAINFFTSINLGGLTDGLREHLKNAPKLLAAQMQAQMLEQAKLDKARKRKRSRSSSSSSSSSSSASDSSGSSSDSSSSDSGSSSGSSSSSSDSGSDSDSDSSSSDSESSSSSSSSSDRSVARRRDKAVVVEKKREPSPPQLRSHARRSQSIDRMKRRSNDRNEPRRRPSPPRRDRSPSSVTSNPRDRAQNRERGRSSSRSFDRGRARRDDSRDRGRGRQQRDEGDRPRYRDRRRSDSRDRNRGRSRSPYSRDDRSQPKRRRMDSPDRQDDKRKEP
jgi:pre-mRNA-splicing factor CWC22